MSRTPSAILAEFHERKRTREYLVCRELAWGDFFAAAAEQEPGEIQPILLRIAQTLRQRAQQQVRQQGLALLLTDYFTLNGAVNPPLVVRQLVRNQVGVQFIYGSRETATQLADWFSEQTGDGAERSRMSQERALEFQTNNAYGESYQPEPADYLRFV